MLKSLMLRQEYRSNESIIARDLYERCLPRSARFDRAVGFFASSVFAACPEAFHAFFEGRGRMRVVCCPILEGADIDAIVKGYRNRPELLRDSALALLMERRIVASKRARLLSWLVAAGRLDLRIAIRAPQLAGEIYHEKLGIFCDASNDCVVFSGSANESFGGIVGNFESVDVYRSWMPEERRRVDQKRSSFEKLWENDTAGLEIIPFFQAASRGELRARPLRENERGATPAQVEADTTKVPAITGIEEVLFIPGEISLRDHQVLAIRNWFTARGRGIFQMATGSGKTITALAAAVKLLDWVARPMLIVIVCPFLHLCSQWIEESRRFGLDPLLCAVGRGAWIEPFSTRLFNLASGTRRIASVVVSNATFADDAFQSLLRRAPVTSLLVADEVHNIGAPGLRNALPLNFRFRLGLSATPERRNDPEGSTAILAYFGEPVIKYDLRQALADGVLCEYRYFPILVVLDDDELDTYLDLTRRIAQLLSQGEPVGQTSYLDSLLLQRARVLASCRGKIPALVDSLRQLRHTTHNLVYCGDGTVEDTPDVSIVRQIDAVVRALGRDLGMTVAKYVADTPLTRRSALRRRFADGELQGLVAIRCLDEGVDIPETQRAFILASSSNPRQFIQRRGRILRRSQGKSIAEIYDFIVRPSAEECRPSGALFPVVRKLFRRELHRILEFASLAVNGPEALHALLPIRDALNLLDFTAEDENTDDA